MDKRSIKSRIGEYLRKINLDISPSGMIRCPFHDDETASMKLYDAGARCFVCNSSFDIFDFAAWRLAVPCDKTHFPEICRDIERTLGIPAEWKPSADERREHCRRNRNPAGGRILEHSKSAIYRSALLDEMALAVDYENHERAHLLAELIFALYLLPDETEGKNEPEPDRAARERLRMAERLALEKTAAGNE